MFVAQSSLFEYGRRVGEKRSLSCVRLGSLDLCLEAEETANVGTLLHNDAKKKVSILHRKTNGDALVHDGRRIFMVPGNCVRKREELEKLLESDGRKRLALVKSIYERLMSGELDPNYIREQCEKLGFELPI